MRIQTSADNREPNQKNQETESPLYLGLIAKSQETESPMYLGLIQNNPETKNNKK
jgi:hypothetical protein